MDAIGRGGSSPFFKIFTIHYYGYLWSCRSTWPLPSCFNLGFVRKESIRLIETTAAEILPGSLTAMLQRPENYGKLRLMSIMNWHLSTCGDGGHLNGRFHRRDARFCTSFILYYSPVCCRSLRTMWHHWSLIKLKLKGFCLAVKSISVHLSAEIEGKDPTKLLDWPDVPLCRPNISANLASLISLLLCSLCDWRGFHTLLPSSWTCNSGERTNSEQREHIIITMSRAGNTQQRFSMPTNWRFRWWTALDANNFVSVNFGWLGHWVASIAAVKDTYEQ